MARQSRMAALWQTLVAIPQYLNDRWQQHERAEELTARLSHAYESGHIPTVHNALTQISADRILPSPKRIEIMSERSAQTENGPKTAPFIRLVTGQDPTLYSPDDRLVLAAIFYRYGANPLASAKEYFYKPTPGDEIGCLVTIDSALHHQARDYGAAAAKGDEAALATALFPISLAHIMIMRGGEGVRGALAYKLPTISSLHGDKDSPARSVWEELGAAGQQTLLSSLRPNLIEAVKPQFQPRTAPAAADARLS
jgi:hypothetical protein